MSDDGEEFYYEEADPPVPVSRFAPLDKPGNDQCPTCGGDGWIIDHDVECYESGDCIGCGGRQVPCSDPRGHADPCSRCDGMGNVWLGDGPGDCRHCTGGYVFRHAAALNKGGGDE